MKQIRKALVVGINEYPFADNYPKLNAAKEDAYQIVQLLAQNGGFTTIISLPTSLTTTKGELDAKTLENEEALKNLVSLAHLQDAIEKLFHPLDDFNFPDVALFYFSGHGWLDPETQQYYLLTSNSDPQKKRNLLSMRWLREQIKKSKVPQKVVFLDCCHSGGFLIEESLELSSSDTDSCFVTACRPSQSAQEDRQNGFLTRKLLELFKLDENTPFVTNSQLEEKLKKVVFPNGQEPLCKNAGKRTIILTDQAFQELVRTDKSPYQSLNYFDVKDGDLFFGRTKLTNDLIKRVAQQHQLIVVAGASGSGKSSLLRAGLLYQLKKGKIKGSDRWIYFDPLSPFTPSGLLLRAKPQEFSEFLQEITEQQKQNFSSQDQRKLLIIDQFEECFTKIFDDDSRKIFFDWIKKILEENPELTIILGIRSDFRATLQKSELAEKIIKPIINVTHLNEKELEEAIFKPAKKVGLFFEPKLEVQLMRDVEDYPESLPLLQFVLNELWELTQKPPRQDRLFLDDYKKIGGIERTLNERADKVFSSLKNERERKIAQRIFLELIQIGEGRDTRRKVRLKDLVNSHPYFNKFEELEAVAKKLEEANLISFDDDEQYPKSRLNPLSQTNEQSLFINLTHEALLYHWEQFKKWKDELEIPMLTERQLEYQAETWRKNGRKNKDLLTYGQVVDALNYKNDPKYLGFLDRSAEEFIERSKIHRYRQRGGQIAISALFVSSIISLAAFAKSQEWVASIRKDIATTNSQLTDDPVQGLVSAIKFTSATQKNGWNLLLTAATDPKNWWNLFRTADINALATDEVQPALQNALRDVQEYNRLTGNELSINDVVISKDGRQIVSGGVDSTVRIWDTKTNKLSVLKGHDDSVVDIVISRDGTKIVSGSLDNTVKVWDTQSGKLLHTLLHKDSVTDVVMSQDGKTIASSSVDRKIYVWNASSGKRLHLLVEHKGSISDIVMAQDGKTIVSASLDQTIGVWDTTTGKLRYPLLKNQSPVTSVAITQDGKTIISSSQDNKVRIWNAKTGELLYTLTGHQGTITSVKISPDDQIIACAGEDAVIRLWDLKTGKLRYTLLGHQASINMMMFGRTQDNTKLILFSAGKDKTIRLWDTGSGRLLDVLVGHTNPIEAIDFHPQTNTLVSASGDRTVRIWHPDLRTPQYLPTDKFSEIPVPSSVNAVATNPNSSIIAVGGSGNVVQLWNLQSNQPVELQSSKNPSQRHTGTIYTLAFSPDGKSLASADADHNIFLWDIPSRNFKKSLKNQEGNPVSIYTLAFNPTNSHQLASGGRDKKIWLWDTATGQYTLLGEHDGGSISTIAFSPDGEILASGDRKGYIRLWDIKTKQLIRTLAKHRGSINALAFHPQLKNKNLLVSASTDRTILQWNTDTGESQDISQTDLNQHTGSIQTIAFSYDGKYLASAGNDTTIRLWKQKEDTSDAYEFDRIIGKHQAPVYTIAFSADNKILVSGGDDATVHYWSVNKLLPDLKPACERLLNHPVREDVKEICQSSQK